jgi:hypothetical protein
MRRWRGWLAVALMLLALFAYLSTLDESDPSALPDAVEADAGR